MKRRIVPFPAALLVAATVLGGCGGGTSSTPPTTTAPAAKPSTLTIKLHPGNLMGAKEHDYTLTCAPAGGTLPDAAKACAALSASVTLLAPTAECPIRVGDVGSQEVTGTWQGAPLALAFHGCAGDEDRWPKLAAALGL
jgi:hypothetical protein